MEVGKAFRFFKSRYYAQTTLPTATCSRIPKMANNIIVVYIYLFTIYSYSVFSFIFLQR